MALKSLTKEEELTVTLSTKFYEPSEEIYDMTRNPRGYCVIFHNYKGVNDNVFPERHGSQYDCESLKHVFSQLNFDVKVYENRTSRQISVICSDLSQKNELVNHNAFVLIILSHGDNGCVTGVDGKSVELNALFAYFTTDNCERLAHKPKIFFISACRGGKRDRILDNAVPNNDARHARAKWSDMLIVYSTIAGYVSFRDHNCGTWLGYTLAHALAKYAHQKPLRDIIDIVDREISKKHATELKNGEIVQSMQSPNIDNRSFNKKLYFNPGIFK